MSELWPISRRGDHRPCITRWLAVAICVSLAIGMLSACSSGSSSTGGTGTPSSPKNTSASGSYQTEATMTDAYSDDYIMMQIPSTWEGGTVEASPRGHTSGVFQTDFCLDGDGNYLVFSVSGMEGDSSSLSCITTWGGLAASTVWEMNNGDQTGLTPKQQESYLLVTTGGSLTRSDVIAMSSRSQARSAGEKASKAYLDKVVTPTVKMNSSSVSKASSDTAGSIAGLHYEESGYIVDLPSYWGGRIMVNEPDHTDGPFEVRSKKYPSRVLCRIEIAQNQNSITGGDIGNSNAKHLKLANGKYACLWVTNYSWLIPSGSLKCPNSEAKELIDLSTGGTKSIGDCEKALSSGGDTLASVNWVSEQVRLSS